METQKEKTKLQMPSKSLTVRILEGDYEIKLPTNGQRIDIESTKINMTNGAHKDLIFGGPNAQDAYVLVEAIATFSILIPKLKADILKSLLDLDPYQSRSIPKAYQKYYEWDSQWREFLNQDLDDEE